MATIGYEEALDTVCWLGLDMAAARYLQRPARSMSSRFPEKLGPVPYHVLCVAAYRGDFALCRRLACDGEYPLNGGGVAANLFPTPMDCAALGSHADIMQLFRQIGPTKWSSRETWLTLSQYYPRWSNAVGCLKGAAQNGSLDIVRMAMAPFVAKRHEHAFAYCKSFFMDAMKYVTSWEVYEEISTLFRVDEFVVDELLRCYTVWGNLPLVRRLADQHGVRVRHPMKRVNDHLLVNAACFFHEDMVDFLLDRGADPNEGEGTKRGSALCAAAAAGSLSIVRKLLDRGARAGGVDYDRAIVNALEREHTAMVELLLERDNVEPGARTRQVEGQTVPRRNFIRRIKNNGLDSMVELLEKHGMTL